jgi:hypothetical protein
VSVVSVRGQGGPTLFLFGSCATIGSVGTSAAADNNTQGIILGGSSAHSSRQQAGDSRLDNSNNRRWLSANERVPLPIVLALSLKMTNETEKYKRSSKDQYLLKEVLTLTINRNNWKAWLVLLSLGIPDESLAGVFDQPPFTEARDKRDFTPLGLDWQNEVTRRAHFLAMENPREHLRKVVFASTRGQPPRPKGWKISKCQEWLSSPVHSIATSADIEFLKSEILAYKKALEAVNIEDRGVCVDLVGYCFGISDDDSLSALSGTSSVSANNGNRRSKKRQYEEAEKVESAAKSVTQLYYHTKMPKQMAKTSQLHAEALAQHESRTVQHVLSVTPHRDKVAEMLGTASRVNNEITDVDRKVYVQTVQNSSSTKNLVYLEDETSEEQIRMEKLAQQRRELLENLLKERLVLIGQHEVVDDGTKEISPQLDEILEKVRQESVVLIEQMQER